jgi:hypothetical protein
MIVSRFWHWKQNKMQQIGRVVFSLGVTAAVVLSGYFAIRWLVH